MTIKKLLCAATAIMLSASVMLTGCGDVEDDSSSKVEKEGKISADGTVKGNLRSAFATAGNTMETVTDVVKGETDKAYDASISLELGSEFAKEFGVESLEKITIGSETKAKGGNLSTSLTASYNNQKLASFNAVKTADGCYVQLSELSQSYAKIENEDLSQWLEMPFMTSKEMAPQSNASGLLTSINIDNTGVPDFDAEKFEAKVKDYIKVIDENLPAKTKGNPVEGKIGDVSYKLDTEALTITGEDAKKILTVLSDKILADKELLDMFTSTGKIKSEDITEVLTEMKDSIKAEDAKESVAFTLYKLGDEYTGVKFSNDGSAVDMFCYYNDSQFCMSVSATEEGGVNSIEASGSVDGAKTNALVNFKASDNTAAEIKLSDFEIVDEESGAFKGKFSMKATDNGKPTAEIICESNSTADKLDLGFTINSEGKKLISVEFTGSETTASDITLPSGKIYDLKDEAQSKEFETEIGNALPEFQKSLEPKLGKELYDSVIGGNLDGKKLPGESIT